MSTDRVDAPPPLKMSVDRFTEALQTLLVERFEQVQGAYLDRGTSLFETLATISAEEASRPVSMTCASIAGQVEHVRVYVEVLERYLRGEEVGEVDWDATWNVTTVTDAEWAALIDRLHATYASAAATIRGVEAWDGVNDPGDAWAIVVHTAYHLGEIRQALGTVRR